MYHYGHIFLTSLTWLKPVQTRTHSTIDWTNNHSALLVPKTEIVNKMLPYINESRQNIDTKNTYPITIDPRQTIFIKIYTFLNGKYLLDILFNNYFISVGLKAGYTISKILDKGIIELIGPFGLTEGSYAASYNLSKLDSGVITTYALYITLGLISILFMLFSPFLFNSIGAQAVTTEGVQNIIALSSGTSIKILLISVFTVLFIFSTKYSK